MRGGGALLLRLASEGWREIVRLGHSAPLGARRLARDREAGALCSAHVPRNRPSADASSFTSLRRAPHRPDQPPHSSPRTAALGQLAERTGWSRVAGGRRSEVKEEVR